MLEIARSNEWKVGDDAGHGLSATKSHCCLNCNSSHYKRNCMKKTTNFFELRYHRPIYDRSIMWIV
jgi:hypothetical protein